MPLRKQGTIVKSSLALGLMTAAVLPSTANAGLLDSLFKPKATTTTSAATTPTSTPAATSPASTSTSTAATSGGVTTTNTATTSATSATTSSAVPSGTGCTPLPTTKSFQKVDGDTADYSLAPNGNFESGTTGWTLAGGAKVVSLNETLGVAPGKKAVQIPLSGSITSPAFCVDETNPHFRFTYKVDNAVLSGFIAYVIYRDAAGKITNVQLVSSKTLALTPSLWQATPKSPLSTIIPLNSTTKTASVQLKITALNPTDFVLDTADAIIGENAATAAVHQVGSAASGLVGAITGAVSPALNIGITVDSVMVDQIGRAHV
jgi:hypothetical protein